MARERIYGWSPEQLARINARREASGQEAYIDKRFSDPNYANRYIGQSESYAPRMQKSISPAAKDEEKDKLSMGTGAEDRTKKFREKFKPKGSMAAEYGVKSRLPSVTKNGVKGGVGVMQNSLDRLSGQV